MAKSQRKLSEKKRKVKLNEDLNYRLKPRDLKDTERTEWIEFKKDLELHDIGTEENIDYIHSHYCSVMQTNVSKPQINNSKLPLIHMMDKLDIVHNSYK